VQRSDEWPEGLGRRSDEWPEPVERVWRSDERPEGVGLEEDPSMWLRSVRRTAGSEVRFRCSRPPSAL